MKLSVFLWIKHGDLFKAFLFNTGMFFLSYGDPQKYEVILRIFLLNGKRKFFRTNYQNYVIITCATSNFTLIYPPKQGLRTPNEGKWIKNIWKIGLMWQTKYASTVTKNLGLGLNFRTCSEGYFLSGRP